MGELESAVARIAELEAELDATRRKLHALLAGSQNILWEVDREGIVTMSEGAGLATVGLRPGQTVGMSVRDMYAESPEILAGMERGLRGEAFSNRIETAGVLFENHYVPHKREDGTLISLLGVTLVLGARPDTKLEIQRAEERLQGMQKQESLAVLAGGIAHDFNNLLVASMGHAELALRLLPEGSKVAEHLNEIAHSAERSADLCRQLLAYAGRGQFIVDVVDLNHIVQDSIRLIELAIAPTSTLHTVLAPNLLPFRGDATQIAQVLINLMKNASDAAEGKQSTIHLETGMRYVDPDGSQRFTIAAPDAQACEYVFVRVRDEGVGMPSAVLGRIFDPFYSTKQTGRGLGLAAVVGIVRAHHGLLEVETKVGVGTTMGVYLPVAKLVLAPRVDAPRGEHSTLRGVTVLLVDDDDAVRRTTRAMLEDVGCKVIEAVNGRDAVDAYRAHGAQVHAVVMDLNMPIMGGAGALRELNALRPEARVILISGYTEVDTAGSLASLKPAAFLQKPYRMQQLFDLLSAIPLRASQGE